MFCLQLSVQRRVSSHWDWRQSFTAQTQRYNTSSTSHYSSSSSTSYYSSVFTFFFSSCFFSFPVIIISLKKQFFRSNLTFLLLSCSLPPLFLSSLSPPPPQLTSSRRTGRCWSSCRSGSLCFLTWWRLQEEEEGKKKEVWSSAPPPPPGPLPPPGTCSEPTLLTLLRPSRSSPPPSLKVSFYFQFSCEIKWQHQTEPLCVFCIFSGQADWTAAGLQHPEIHRNQRQPGAQQWVTVTCWNLMEVFFSQCLSVVCVLNISPTVFVISSDRLVCKMSESDFKNILFTSTNKNKNMFSYCEIKHLWDAGTNK